MNTCRICLTKNVHKLKKDICQMQYDKNTSYVDLMMFCLNIQISPETKLSTQLCMKCFRKLVSFYKFKLLALKSNEYLSHVQQVSNTHETEVLTIKNEDSKDGSIIQEYPLYTTDVKEEIDTIVSNLKQEPNDEVLSDNIESDDELLSLIKLNKKEDDPEYVVENEKVKKGKGGLRTQICEECGKSVKNLKDHMRLHQPVDKRKYYQCKLCPQIYASATGRNKHFKSKHLLMKKKCNICNKEVGNLRSHMLIVHDKSNLPFACEHCDHRCLSKSLLEIHAAIHSTEKPFQCDLCQAKFRTLSLKQTHKRQVHDKEKPHMCQYCSKRFFKKNHMQLHIRFMERFDFPGITGCIDGTHVAIIRPKEHEESYFNRKNYHSLNVSLICDVNLNIMFVDASFGGASHDSYVWNQCPIKTLLETLHRNGERCWLLGDSGYAQRPWMMTPILGAASGSAEEYYTDVHCRVRNTVERCIGVLKARWRCLLAHRVLHYDPVTAGRIVNACVVLHNIANARNMPLSNLPADDLHQDQQRNVSNREVNTAQIPDITRIDLVSRLWTTRRIHTDERPCKCSECGKCFRTSTSLRKHQLIHLNDKKHACQQCDMAFITNSGLRAHMITHTKIKRYPCSFCGVKFGRSDHRRKHERTAHLKHHSWPNGTAVGQAEKS